MYVVHHRVLTAKEIACNGLKYNRNKKLEFIDANEKGRGIITLEDINKGEFVAEYKYDDCFPVKEREIKDKEYAGNHEGCYILEAQLPNNRGWICLDATRNINSWGRYFNHSPVSCANLKMHAPLKVNDKWRVAFLAICDIKKGEELLYDYGQQPHPPDWMKRRSKVCLHNNVWFARKTMLLLQGHQQNVAGTNDGEPTTPLTPSLAEEHAGDNVNNGEPATQPMFLSTAEDATEDVKNEEPTTLPTPSAEDEKHVEGAVAVNDIQVEACMTLPTPSSAAEHEDGAAKFTSSGQHDIPEKTTNADPAIHPPASTMKKCGLCSSEGRAEAFCEDCNEFTCQSCTMQHSIIKLFAQHKIISVEEGTKLEPNCGLRSCEARAEAFCKDCREFICKSCTTQHSVIKLFARHKIVTVEEGTRASRCVLYLHIHTYNHIAWP